MRVRVCRWYGRRPLKCWCVYSPSSADVDVDRLPPLAGRSCRRRARRRRPRAAPRRPTRRRTCTRCRAARGEPLLGLQARARGVAGRAELADEPRAGDGLAGSRSGCTSQLAPSRSKNSSLRAAGRQADADRGPARRRRALRSAACRAGSSISSPGAQHVDLAVQLHAHRRPRSPCGARSTPTWTCATRDEAPRAADDVDLGVLAAGRLARSRGTPPAGPAPAHRSHRPASPSCDPPRRLAFVNPYARLVPLWMTARAAVFRAGGAGA